MRRAIFGLIVTIAVASPASADRLAEHLVAVRAPGAAARGTLPAGRGAELRASDVQAIQLCKDRVQHGTRTVPDAHEDPEPLPDSQLTRLAAGINRCLAGSGRADLKVIPSREKVKPVLR